MKQRAPYGSWPGLIDAAMVAGKSVRISDLRVDSGRVFWIQSLPEEKGRNTIMCADESGAVRSLLPRPLSARSKVHEYGGAPFAVLGETLFFVLADDQRIYRMRIGGNADDAMALSPPDQGYRFGDLVVDTHRERLLAVCESHREDGDVTNTLVALDCHAPGTLLTLVSGHDFVTHGRLSPTGTHLVWITWNHPDMPWDATTLWLAALDSAGMPMNPKILAGGPSESVSQPLWSPQGDLIFVSDRSDWWNLYRVSASKLSSNDISPEALAPLEGEFATPAWTLGMANSSFSDANTLVSSFTQNGTWRLCRISLRDKNAVIEHIPSALTEIHSVASDGKVTAFIGASPSEDASVFRLEDDNLHLLAAPGLALPSPQVSAPEAFSFNTTDGETAHALFYPPTHPEFEGLMSEETPPVIALCHGGPTGATEAKLNLKIQFWTQRGFAVVDVNYRGSTGYGRRYRQSLNQRWGVADVDDMCAAIDALTAQGKIDPERSIIKGSSAGGFTVLAALAFRDRFRAGVNLYGVADLQLLAEHTHKFEARYLDRLVGPYPEAARIYRERSPLFAADRIQCPLLIFQGLEDKVVPPEQSDTIFNAVKDKGVPVAYVTFPKEGHGFRQADTIEKMLAYELAFYLRVLKIPTAHDVDTYLQLHNANRLG